MVRLPYTTRAFRSVLLLMSCAALVGCPSSSATTGHDDAGRDAEGDAPAIKPAKVTPPTPLVLEIPAAFVMPTLPAHTPFCPKEEFEACAKACDAGDVTQCVALGLARRSYYDKTAAAASQKLLERGCDAGSTEACYHLGETYRTGHGVPKAPETARALHERACAAKYPASCFSLALILGGEDTAKPQAKPTHDTRKVLNQNRTTPSKDRAARNRSRKALNLTARACRLGVVRACSATARLLGEGKDGVPKDLTAAAQYHKLACDGGRSRDCLLLAFLLDEGKDGAPQDQAEAARLYDVACNTDGNMFACARLGKMLGLGLGVPKEMDRALKLLWKACNSISTMCGEGVEVFQASCDAGGYDTCNDLGLIYLYAKGVDKDAAKARDLFTRACQNGQPAGCTGLGLCHANGEGGDANPQLAVELFDRACKEGHLKGCSNLGLMYYRGQGVRKNLKRARKIWKTRCAQGHKDACTLQQADAEGKL